MADTFCLYVDDSGSRFPDKRVGQYKSPWFGLGGILLREADEERARALFHEFRAAWAADLPVDVPLRSYDLRQGKDEYRWLRRDPAKRNRFLAELGALVISAPILCTGCVIDRAGYESRYFNKYDADKRWRLCKTAFSVLLERTVKFLEPQNAVVRVYVERTDKEVDRSMHDYYKELRANGMPFDKGSMASYQPLEPEALRRVLYEFRTKDKTSPLMQLADVCLYPVCNGGYDKTGRDYQSLIESKKLIDCVLSGEQIRTMGVKYSCFDNVVARVAAAPR